LLTGITYTLTYLPYFLQGNNLIDFLKAQKWIFHYWTSSPVKPIPGMIFIIFLTGFNKGWHENATWEKVSEWTIFWPFYLITLFLMVKSLFKRKKNRNSIKLYLKISIIAIFIPMIFIPLFVRYLLLVIPLLIIFFIDHFKKYFNLKNIFIKTIFLTFFLFQLILFLNPSPKSSVKEILRTWHNTLYQDMYNFIEIYPQRIDRWQFWRQMRIIEKKLGIYDKKIEIQLQNYYPWKKEVKGNLLVSYQTKIGSFKNNYPVKFIKNNGYWKMVWEKNYLLPDFEFGDNLSANFTLGKYGKILLNDGTILSQEEKRPFFLVIKKEIKDDKKIQQQLSNLTNKKEFEIKKIYLPNSLSDIPEEIGFIKEEYNLQKFKTETLENGIIMEMRKTRVYYPNHKKNFSIDKIKEIEIKYSNLINPQWGGEIIIKKKNGKQIIFQKKEKKDGKDAVL